ncbi:MAG: hypothetical protein E6J78_00925 [Deltaproteobacteria bacterium]|nr:MAG: hypothetical protein E6J78_00925 [Deltaproteobacteria bacterium]
MRAALSLLLAACTSGRSPARTVVVVSDPPPALVEDAPCASDADCAFTRVAVGETACCPLLCSPRVVTKARAKELQDRIPTCHKGRACPEPACRPPREVVAAACLQGKCVTKPVASPAQRN